MSSCSCSFSVPNAKRIHEKPKKKRAEDAPWIGGTENERADENPKMWNPKFADENPKIFSVAGTWTRVSRVRAEYPNQLDYNGEDISKIFLKLIIEIHTIIHDIKGQ